MKNASRLVAQAFDENHIKRSAYRWSFDVVPWSLVANFLHCVGVRAKAEGVINFRSPKCFLDRGVHIVLARELRLRRVQLRLMYQVANTHWCWYDSRANVWKVEAGERTT